MSQNITEVTSEELIEKHRELNKKSGAKSHLATPSVKSLKLHLKDEIARRAREYCDECNQYLESSDRPSQDEMAHIVFQPHPGHGRDSVFGHGVPKDFVPY